MLNKFFTYLIGCCLLAGCAVQNISPSYNFSSSSGKGVLLASLTFSGNEYGLMQYHVRSLFGQSNSIDLAANPTNMVLDWGIGSTNVGNGLTGRVIAIELPAGEYEFSGWMMSSRARALTSTKNLDFKFKIVPGKAVYAGSFHTQLFNDPKVAKVRYKTIRADLRSRDLEIVRKRFPTIPMSIIDFQVSGEQTDENDGVSLDSLKDLLKNNEQPSTQLNDLKDLLPK